MDLIHSLNKQSSDSKGDKELVLQNLLVMPNRYYQEEDLLRLSNNLKSNFNTYILNSYYPSGDDVSSFVEAIRKELEDKRIRNFTLLGIGPGASIAQAFAIFNMRSVRRLVLCNATSRIKPNFWAKLIDRLEKYLPLGLPLRSMTKDFDSRPYLHRIYCPTLVTYSLQEYPYVIEQSKYIGKQIPNSWLNELQNRPITEFGEFSQEFIQMLSEFMKVPAKRPQKNVRVA